MLFKSRMRITNLNPLDDIGASAWLVEIDGHRLLLDSGTDPRHEGRQSLPLYRLVDGVEIDAIAITHCHHDHIGSLPVTMRRFPRAHVLMTDLSYFLAERVLHNSVNVMIRQRDELAIAEYPLYSHDEVDEIAPRFQGFRYEREVVWAALYKTRAGITSPILEFRDAGHTLGSAGILVRGRHETLFYTGDVSFRDQTLHKGARFEGIEADALILETTRGTHPFKPGFSRQAEEERLLSAIRRVLDRKGCVLIPAFALGRTQEVLALLALWMRQKRLRTQPVYIGGLGRVFTEIYDLEAHRTHRHHTNLMLHEALNLVVLDQRSIESFKPIGGRIYVLTAGMMNEHTAAHDIAVRIAHDERHGILFVGYADPDTPGGRLKASRPGQPFLFSSAAGEIIRNCELAEFDLTAHANRDELLQFAQTVADSTVILGHGAPAARDWFAAGLAKARPRLRVLQPGPGESVEV